MPLPYCRAGVKADLARPIFEIDESPKLVNVIGRDASLRATYDRGCLIYKPRLWGTGKISECQSANVAESG
jgi:hypothetical protein